MDPTSYLLVAVSGLALAIVALWRWIAASVKVREAQHTAAEKAREIQHRDLSARIHQVEDGWRQSIEQHAHELKSLATRSIEAHLENAAAHRESAAATRELLAGIQDLRERVGTCPRKEDG